MKQIASTLSNYYMKQLVNYFSILILLASVSCAKPPQKFEGLAAYQIKTVNGKPNYADLHFWAAHPFKHDPSDSIPEPLRKNYKADSAKRNHVLKNFSIREELSRRMNH